MPITIAITEAQTDVAPFIPQSQGVKEEVLADANFIPRGKGIPIKNPNGKSIPTAKSMRIIVDEPRNISRRSGVNILTCPQ